MTSERRLRWRLRRLAADVDPDVEERMQRSVAAAGLGRRPRNVAALVLQTAAVAAFAIVVLVQIASRPTGPAANGSAVLGGAWTTSIASADPGTGITGTWTIQFPSTGVLEVTPPSGFTSPYSGYSFRQTGDELRTDLLGESLCSGLAPGTYRLDRTTDSLRFVVVNDACPARIELLTSTTWAPVR